MWTRWPRLGNTWRNRGREHWIQTAVSWKTRSQVLAFIYILQDGKLRPHAIKPSQTAIQSGEFEGKTTHKLDYDRKNVCLQRDLLIWNIFMQAERAKAIRPAEHMIQSGEFAGNTTHRVDYDKKQASLWWNLKTVTLPSGRKITSHSSSWAPRSIWRIRWQHHPSSWLWQEERRTSCGYKAGIQLGAEWSVWRWHDESSRLSKEKWRAVEGNKTWRVCHC